MNINNKVQETEGGFVGPEAMVEETNNQSKKKLNLKPKF